MPKRPYSYITDNPYVTAILCSVIANYVSKILSYGIVNTGLENLISGIDRSQLISVIMYLCVLVFVFIMLSIYYNKIKVRLGYQILNIKLSPIKRFFRTYAMWARFTAWLFITLLSILLPHLRSLCIIYSIYFVGILWWTTRSNYRYYSYMIVRASFDFGLAYFAASNYGGIASPASLLFFIPLCSVARNYKFIFSLFWSALTCFAIIKIAQKETNILNVIISEKFSKLFTNESWLTPDIMLLGVALILSAICILILAIFELERRKMFHPMLSEVVEIWKKFDEEYNFDKMLKNAVEKIDCEMIIYIANNACYYSINKVIEDEINCPGDNGLLVTSNNSEANKICGIINQIMSRETRGKNKLISIGNIDDTTQNKLSELNLFPECIGQRKIQSIEAVPISNEECIIAINQFAYNRIAIHNFSLQSICRLNLFGGQISSIFRTCHSKNGETVKGEVG